MAEVLAINKIGTEFRDQAYKNTIYRVKSKPPPNFNYPYLIVSDKINDPKADILVVQDFRRIKDRLKGKIRKGTGLESTVHYARKMNGAGVAKWFAEIGDLYRFCKSVKCQFILSSGASSAMEMVSGQCFDSILCHCEINPHNYWDEINEWIESKCSGVTTANA